jgi:hypothetical protein
LWCTDPGNTPVALTLRGWTAEATVDAVGMAWTIDGVARFSSQQTGCGAERRPAATWQPQTKGSYTIDFVSTWAGTWTLTYPGIDAQVFTLGPLDFAAPTVPYEVDEFVGVLTND